MSLEAVVSPGGCGGAKLAGGVGGGWLIEDGAVANGLLREVDFQRGTSESSAGSSVLPCTGKGDSSSAKSLGIGPGRADWVGLDRIKEDSSNVASRDEMTFRVCVSANRYPFVPMSYPTNVSCFALGSSL